MTTFYDVLGVSPDATTEAIRAAYRERLKESHPDLNDDEDASEVTKRIVRARDVLTDEAERRRYDRLGHDDYVGGTDEAVDEDDVSDAAAAARRAGWASDGSDRSEDRASARSGGRTSARGRRSRRTRDRRRRERAAAERVGATTDDGGVGETNGEATATADGGTATASAPRTGVHDGVSGSDSGSGWAESAGGSYSVRQRHDTRGQRSRLIPSARSIPLLGATFLLYPLMVFSAVFPPFPLVVNVVVGLCIVLLVGYLQSVPEVGVIVFGIWSLFTPLAFLAAGVPLTGLVGIVALTGTWLPFGLSVLTTSLVRP